LGAGEINNKRGIGMISALRKKRFFAEKSIYDLGKMTGIDPAKISLIERGYKNPRDDEKKSLSKALNCPVQEIFPAIEGDNG
jgi:transcriptional regulator with XRE-family HTH domain